MVEVEGSPGESLPPRERVQLGQRVVGDEMRPRGAVGAPQGFVHEQSHA
ncbi:hypothetical protein CZ771_03325 [Actinomycetales bacterium JB111]|nr:hypothetical protein CZ771_03325 [Actinomycetales bacterium JB111]